ncbi:MAG: triose-phosphate isomerase, partial [Bacteroidales bacterium]|nr:triose-phosphate isomerase [Bacteroidales bacterium]
MRKKIVAGNWKMNKTFQEAENLIDEIIEVINGIDENKVRVVVCPPAVYLELATDIAIDNNLYIGAQNVSQYESGAYTGEISAEMLNSLEVDYCIIGHSERRKYFNETNEMLAGKIDRVLKNDILPIFCCGELLPEREAGKHFNIVKSQIEESLFHLSSEQFANIVIAYEPVWAIGTGVNATPGQAQEMHAFIRSILADKYGQEIAE